MTVLVSVSGPSSWRHFDTCSLEISVGGRFHEGEYLRASVEWVNGHFRTCIVNIGDTLYRHNMQASGMPADESERVSRKSGDDWLGRNQDALRAFTGTLVVKRWDDLRFDPRFDTMHRAYAGLYTSNAVFRGLVDEAADTFGQRRAGVSPAELARLRPYSIRYVLEELAGDSVLASDHGYVHVYPHNVYKVYKALQQGRIDSAPDALKRICFTKLFYRDSAAERVIIDARSRKRA